MLGISPYDQVGGEDPVHQKAAQQSAKENLAAHGPARLGAAHRGQLLFVPRAGILFNRSSECGDIDNGRFHPWRSALLLEEFRKMGVLTESRTLTLGEDGINEHELRADRLGQQTNDLNLAGSQDGQQGSKHGLASPAITPRPPV